MEVWLLQGCSEEKELHRLKPVLLHPQMKSSAKISVVPMITATYFMVAGGPYGLEDIVQKTGYSATLLILVLTPLLWSLPTALMVSEARSVPAPGSV